VENGLFGVQRQPKSSSMNAFTARIGIISLEIAKEMRILNGRMV